MLFSLVALGTVHHAALGGGRGWGGGGGSLRAIGRVHAIGDGDGTALRVYGF